MIRHQIILVLLSVALLGCRPKSRATRIPEPNPQATNMTDVGERITELQKLSVELSALAKNLPGRDPTEDRQLLGNSFDRASSALALLMGPQPHGGFRQQLRIIENVRRDVRAGTAT